MGRGSTQSSRKGLGSGSSGKTLAQRLEEFGRDIKWAFKVLRRARRYFKLGYSLMVSGMIFQAMSRIVEGSASKLFGFLGVICIGGSALIYWVIMD